LNKFVQSEQRDPIRIKQIHDTPQLSDWDRYAISGSVHGRKAATRGAIAMPPAQGTQLTALLVAYVCATLLCSYYRLAELPEAADAAQAWAVSLNGTIVLVACDVARAPYWLGCV
jgi:hypothetical protein